MQPQIKPVIVPPTTGVPTTQPHDIGTNTLLMGDVGSGKTSSLPTFIAAGIKHDLELHVAAVMTEPGAVETLLDGMVLHAPKGMKTLPMDRLHYHYIPQTSEDWSALIEMAKRVNLMGYRDLAEMKTGLAKNKHKQFIDLLSCLANFTDQHGEQFGPIDKLDSNWLVGVDSLSGINHMSKQLHVGLKPAMHMGEWQVTMSTEEALVNQLAASTKCFTCLTAHVDKEMDEILGKPQYMAGFLGSKLAPKVPRIFSDVILQVKEEGKFHWSTTRANYSGLKARNLPLSDNLPPSFVQIVDTWLKRKSLVEAGLMTDTQYEATQE